MKNKKIKKVKLIALVFLKLVTPKDVVTETLKRYYFLKPFGSQRVKKRLQHRFFSSEYCNIFKNCSFAEHLPWLLLSKSSIPKGTRTTLKLFSCL